MLTVLVVDDEQIIRSLAQKILTHAGHEVILTESGAQAVEVVSRQGDGIDMVLLDMRMEGMSGIETLRHIRNLYPELPCIISTGNASEVSDFPADLRLNVEALQKPYRAKELSEMVERLAAAAGVTSGKKPL